jgi:hypothetical protein
LHRAPLPASSPREPVGGALLAPRSAWPIFLFGSDDARGCFQRYSGKLGGRYALALFELARDARQIEAVSASLATLRGAIEQSDDLRTLIASPLIAREEQASASARWSARWSSTR